MTEKQMIRPLRAMVSVAKSTAVATSKMPAVPYVAVIMGLRPTLSKSGPSTIGPNRLAIANGSSCSGSLASGT